MKKLNKNNALKEFADSIKRQECPEVVEKNGELYLYSEKYDKLEIDPSYKTRKEPEHSVIFVNFSDKKRIEK